MEVNKAHSKNTSNTIRAAIFVLGLLLSFYSSAQVHKGEFWGAYISNISLNSRFKIWHDYHYVHNGFAIIRPGITFQTLSGAQFTAGYAYVKAATSNTTTLVRQENRLWGQFIKSYQIQPKLKYIIRLRYDARYRQSLDSSGDVITGDYSFNHRYRLMQNIRYTLKSKSAEEYWHLDLINETLYNRGKVISDGFDQIRSYLLVGYTKPGITVLAGYHQRYIPASGDYWTMNHGFTLWVTHSIHLKLNKKKDN